MGTESYTLGKGRLSFKPDVAGVEGKSYMRLGNAPEFTLTLTTEKLEHFSSMSGLQLKDASVITKTTLMGAFTLDEPSAENLRLFFMTASKYTYTQASQAVLTAVAGENAAAGQVNIGALGTYIPLYHSAAGTPVASAVTESPNNTGTLDVTALAGTLTHTSDTDYEVMVSTAGTPDSFIWRKNGGAWSTEVAVTGSPQLIEEGLTIDFDATTGGVVGDSWSFSVNVANTAGTRVMDITDGAGTFELKDPTNTITYVEGATANYQVDRNAGILYINPDQTGALVVNAITPADGFLVKAKWNALTNTTHNDSFTLTTLKGHLMFVGDPPMGEAIDVQGYVSLTPTGDFSAIGTDWTQFKFQAEYLTHDRYKDSNNLQGLARVTNRMVVG